MSNNRFGFIRTMADVQKGLQSLFGEAVRVAAIRFTPDKAAAANINAAAVPTNGQVVTIDDGEGNTEVFEFTDGGGLTVGTVEVDKSLTTDHGMSELATAINGSTVNVTAGTVTGADPYDLPLTKDTQGAVGNTTPAITTTATLTLTQWAGGVDGNLTAAATSQTFPLPVTLPANALVLAAGIQVDTVLSGGAVSAVAVDIGDAGGPDRYLAAADADAATGFVQSPAGADFSGLAGLPVNAAAIVPDVVVNTTGGDVADLDAGDVTAMLWYVAPQLG